MEIYLVHLQVNLNTNRRWDKIDYATLAFVESYTAPKLYLELLIIFK